MSAQPPREACKATGHPPDCRCRILLDSPPAKVGRAEALRRVTTELPTAVAPTRSTSQETPRP